MDNGLLTISLTNPGSLTIGKSDLSITIGGTECKIPGASVNLNSFTCQTPLNSLSKPKVIAKNHQVKVHISKIGYAILSPSITTPITFPYKITSVSPNTVFFP